MLVGKITNTKLASLAIYPFFTWVYMIVTQRRTGPMGWDVVCMYV